MWRIHLSPSYVYYYCPTLFTKTGLIFYSSRFSHLQTLATQRLLNCCGQREWKCLHIVCLCWYVYFYVVKSGDFHCKQMSVQIHKNYLFIFFVVVASELYSQVLFHALVPKLQSQWCIFTELLFLFSGFHLIFPPLLLHFFFLVFLQYFPFLFPCSFLSLYSSALFFPAQNWLSFFCRTCSSSLSCSSWRLFSSHSFCFLFAICIYFPLYCVPIAIMLSFPHPCS